jgi:hypothetical protein
MDPTGAQQMGQLVVNCLAVAGGYLAGWWIVAAISKILFPIKLGQSRQPKAIHTVTRAIGGVALAILVAVIVFGHGHGWTLFGGGAAGRENRGDSTSQISTTVSQKTDDSQSHTPTALKPIAAIDERITVRILGGQEVQADRFYLLDDDTKAKTFDEIKTAIVAKRDQLTTGQDAKSNGKRVGVEIRFSVLNALPQEHPAVTRLARWVRSDAGLSVTFPVE